MINWGDPVLRFSILGPLEVRSETTTYRPRGSLQCRLLLALLANARKLVLIEMLMDEVWPEETPARAENALQAHISRWRHRLNELSPGEDRLITHSSGYQLLVSDDEIDAPGFVSGVERVRNDSRAEADPAWAAQELRSLLALWRGPMLGGMSGGPICRATMAMHEESRLAALELLYDYELRSGNHTKVIGELVELLTQYTFKERFRQQLMIALYRSGRQADAINVYRELWHKLADELGLEPSPAMREYERAVLEQNPALDSLTAGLQT